MTTVNDICERALRKLRVVSRDEPMIADDAAHILDAYNAMMQGFAIGASDPGHTTAQLTSEFGYPARLEEAVVRVLAMRVAQDFSSEPPDARHDERLIEAWFFNPDPAKYPDELTHLPSRNFWSGYLG